jgi:hypothetical protein
LNDTFRIPSNSIISAAGERGIKISRLAAIALVHRMSSAQFHRLKDLRDKLKKLPEKNRLQEKIQTEATHILLEVGRNLLEDPFLIDPAHPKYKRTPLDAKRILVEMRTLVKQLPPGLKASERKGRTSR